MLMAVPRFQLLSSTLQAARSSALVDSLRPTF
jgi:hypothetical protein